MKNSAAAAYGQQSAQAWNRADMLVALYQSGVSALDAAIAAIESNDRMAANKHGLQAVRVIHGIVAGLDFNQGQGELPQQIARLCEFMLFEIPQCRVEGLQASRNIMRSLGEAYEAIGPQASKLEASGEMLPLDLENTLGVSV